MKSAIVKMRSVRYSSVQGYSRVVIEASSTKVGFSCRIDPTRTVVVCMTEAKGRATYCPSNMECSARTPVRAGIKGCQVPCPT